MGLIANLKEIWKHREAIKIASKSVDGIKEAYVKSGWKTSEFWLVVLSNIAAIVPALNGVIPADKAATLLVIVNSVYAIVRALTKAGTLPPPTTPA